jgi:hypothetical protein
MSDAFHSEMRDCVQIILVKKISRKVFNKKSLMTLEDEYDTSRPLYAYWAEVECRQFEGPLLNGKSGGIIAGRRTNGAGDHGACRVPLDLGSSSKQ